MYMRNTLTLQHKSDICKLLSVPWRVLQEYQTYASTGIGKLIK